MSEIAVQWDVCEDIRVLDDMGDVIYNGPRYLRCNRPECHLLVTHGMIERGGCWCGNRRLCVALTLKKTEREALQQGYYPLKAWEQVAIAPCLPPGKTLGWGYEVWKEDYAN